MSIRLLIRKIFVLSSVVMLTVTAMVQATSFHAVPGQTLAPEDRDKLIEALSRDEEIVVVPNSGFYSVTLTGGTMDDETLTALGHLMKAYPLDIKLLGTIEATARRELANKGGKDRESAKQVYAFLAENVRMQLDADRRKDYAGMHLAYPVKLQYFPKLLEWIVDNSIHEKLRLNGHRVAVNGRGMPVLLMPNRNIVGLSTEDRDHFEEDGTAKADLRYTVDGLVTGIDEVAEYHDQYDVLMNAVNRVSDDLQELPRISRAEDQALTYFNDDLAHRERLTNAIQHLDPLLREKLRTLISSSEGLYQGGLWDWITGWVPDGSPSPTPTPERPISEGPVADPTLATGGIDDALGLGGYPSFLFSYAVHGTGAALNFIGNVGTLLPRGVCLPLEYLERCDTFLEQYFRMSPWWTYAGDTTATP